MLQLPKGRANKTRKSHDLRLCYYGFHDAGKVKKQFRPAWSLSFKGEDGKEYNVFVDAYDNSPINHKLDIQIARRKQQPDAIQE